MLQNWAAPPEQSCAIFGLYHGNAIHSAQKVPMTVLGKQLQATELASGLSSGLKIKL